MTINRVISIESNKAG